MELLSKGALLANANASLVSTPANLCEAHDALRSDLGHQAFMVIKR
jgi:hypothetical protein